MNEPPQNSASRLAARPVPDEGSDGGGDAVAEAPRPPGNSRQSISEMRQRHADCIRMLSEKAVEKEEEEESLAEKLQKEMQDLNRHLETKESSNNKTLEVMKEEQLQKVDQMKQEMTANMSKELERMRESSLQDLHDLRHAVEKHVSAIGSSQQEKQDEEVEARVRRMQAELQEALQGQKAADMEAADLRVRLASTQERAKMLQSRQEELRKERLASDEDRRELRQQSEQQWQKLMSTENELQRCKAEAEVQRPLVARLAAAHAEEEESARKAREAARLQEVAVQQDILKLRGQIEEAKRDSEVQALRSQSEQREAGSHLRLQVDRLEAELARAAEQLDETRDACSKLEAEKVASVRSEEELRHEAAEEVRRLQEQIEEAREREAELLEMLEDIQCNIIDEEAKS